MRPHLGQHTEEVLTDILGYPWAELEKLWEERVVRLSLGQVINPGVGALSPGFIFFAALPGLSQDGRERTWAGMPHIGGIELAGSFKGYPLCLKGGKPTYLANS